MLVLRYQPQHLGPPAKLPLAVLQRLSPETLELTAHADPHHTKKVAGMAIVKLSPPLIVRPIAATATAAVGGEAKL